MTHVNLYDGTLEGLPPPTQAGLQRAVPPRGVAGPARRGLPVRPLRRRDGAPRRCRDAPDRETRAGPRLRADRHRPGVRVRLLGHAGVQGAAQRRARGRAGQQQPGDDHDRPGAGRPHLRRAADAGDRRGDHRARAARRAAADGRRPDGAQPGDGAREERRARAVRRRAHRRVGRGDRRGRGPAEVPRRDARDRPRRAARAATRARWTRRSTLVEDDRVPVDHPAVVHAGRRRRRHRLQRRGVPRDRAARPRR